MDNRVSRLIATKATARSTYMIPNQYLTRPQDIERSLLDLPRTAVRWSKRLGVESIFHENPRWGKVIYPDDSEPVLAGEALFLARTHLDTYSVDRSKNPYVETEVVPEASVAKP